MTKRVLELVDNNGNTPLHIAVAHNNIKIIPYILKNNGFQSLIKKNNSNKTPIDLAIENQFNEIFKTFLSSVKKKNICKDYDFGRNLLNKAIECRNLKAIILLLEYKNSPIKLNMLSLLSLTKYGGRSFSQQIICNDFQDILKNSYENSHKFFRSSKPLLKIFCSNNTESNSDVTIDPDFPLHEKLLLYKILIIDNFSELNFRELNYLYYNRVIYKPLNIIAKEDKYKEIYNSLYTRASMFYKKILYPLVIRLINKAFFVATGIPNAKEIGEKIAEIAYNKADVIEVSTRVINAFVPAKQKLIDNYYEATQIKDEDLKIKILFDSMKDYSMCTHAPHKDSHLQYILENSINIIKRYYSNSKDRKFTSKIGLQRLKEVEEALSLCINLPQIS